MQDIQAGQQEPGRNRLEDLSTQNLGHGPGPDTNINQIDEENEPTNSGAPNESSIERNAQFNPT